MQPLELVVEVGATLDRLGIPWVLGGSMASSLVGEPRSTLDIDLAVEFGRANVSAAVEAFGTDFYVDRQMMLDAIDSCGSFNIIHHRSGVKVDMFVLSDERLDRLQIERRTKVDLGIGFIWVGSATDQVLRKLHWYRRGGEVSDRQWRDVLSILVVQGERIDRADMRRTAAEVGLTDLLDRALEQIADGDADG